MYLIELVFECFEDTTISRAEQSINRLLNALRYNGQILGREYPIALQDACFNARLVCPEEDSLHSDFHSTQVKRALQNLAGSGLLQPKIKVLGRDINSDDSDPCQSPSWQILYTSYLQTCSPIRCGEHFMPIPLYHLPSVANGDHKQVIKWQEDWAACDQLQMNGSILEHASIEQLSNNNNRLYQRGLDLCKRLEYLTKTPSYLYLYRVGGLNKNSEQQRLCPSCGQAWALADSLHDIIDFKCEPCRLVSNLSWDFKS